MFYFNLNVYKTKEHLYDLEDEMLELDLDTELTPEVIILSSSFSHSCRSGWELDLSVSQKLSKLISEKLEGIQGKIEIVS